MSGATPLESPSARRAAIVAAARSAVQNPRYGTVNATGHASLASTAYVLGLLAAAEIVQTIERGGSGATPQRQSRPLPSRVADLLSDSEREELNRDLAAMARLRRRAEAESRNVVLP